MYKHTHIYIHIHTHSCTPHVYIHSHKYSYTLTHEHTHTHTHTLMHTRARTWTHAHTHILIHSHTAEWVNGSCQRLTTIFFILQTWKWRLRDTFPGSELKCWLKVGVEPRTELLPESLGQGQERPLSEVSQLPAKCCCCIAVSHSQWTVSYTHLTLPTTTRV